MKIIKDSICCKKKEIEKQTGGGRVNNELSSVTTSEVAVNTNYDTRTVMNICKCIINKKLNKEYNIASWNISVYSNAIEGRANIYQGDIMNGLIVASIFVSLQKGGYIVKLSFGKDKGEKNDCAIFKMQIDDKVTKGFNTDENCSIKEFENILNRKGYSFFDKIKNYFKEKGLKHNVSWESEYKCLCNNKETNSYSEEYFKWCTSMGGWDKDYTADTGFYWNCSNLIKNGFGSRKYFVVNNEGTYYDNNIVIKLSNGTFLKFYVNETKNEIHKF